MPMAGTPATRNVSLPAMETPEPYEPSTTDAPAFGILRVPDHYGRSQVVGILDTEGLLLSASTVITGCRFEDTDLHDSGI